MAHAPLAKVKAATAAEVCRNFDLKEEARPLLREAQSPREFLTALAANKRYAPAIDFLAHALPPREAIWWGCLCLQQARASQLPPVEAAACKAAVAWVLDPSESNRQAAKSPAEAAKLSTPAGGLAMAATWTGGSLAPPMSNSNPKVPPPPPVPPGPFVPAKVVAGAILLAAAKADPVRILDTQRQFVELGVGVAEGRFVWPEVPKRSASGTWTRVS
jgi:hypothetical protein